MKGELKKLDGAAKAELAANGIEMFPREDDICTWDVKINGPKGTPYEDGTFWLLFEASTDYP
jgi:ubiquitin-protein ligase